VLRDGTPTWALKFHDCVTVVDCCWVVEKFSLRVACSSKNGTLTLNVSLNSTPSVMLQVNVSVVCFATTKFSESWTSLSLRKLEVWMARGTRSFTWRSACWMPTRLKSRSSSSMSTSGN
jgi:hypothetical protein